MLHRLRNNFQLSVITLMSAFSVIGITPFAVWRFLRGEPLIGTIDLAIVGGIVAAMIYAWRTNDVARTGFVLALGPCTGGAVAVATLVGEAGLLWLYPALICSFILTKPAIAAVLPLGALLFLLVDGAAFGSEQQMWSYSITLLVVCACTYVFARRSEQQRNLLEHLALLDPLTGVKNRRSMDEELNRAVADHARNRTAYGLVLADLDHFKAINDEHGHAAGDEILKAFVELLKLNIRRSDQIFRYGGEEFVVLLPAVNQASLQAAISHVQDVVRRSLKSPSGPVTTSFGTALLRDSESATDWLDRADRALYLAKERGRDCIVADEEADEKAPKGGN